MIYNLNLKDKIINKFFKNGYGFHNYPENLKYIKNFNFQGDDIEKTYFFEDKSFKKKIKIKLASLSIDKSPISFWKSISYLVDLEDQASAHRWIWAYDLLDNKTYSKKEKIDAINCLINNWFYLFGNNTIDKKDVMHESYTISERLSNYTILSKLGFIKKKKSHIDVLNKQLKYLSNNLEFYYKKKSNHVLNNIRAIIIYSNFTNQKKYLKFANSILNKTIVEFVDKNGFFRFCSSHYQFIFTKWMLDIFLFSYSGNFFKKKLLLNLNACNFFLIGSNNRVEIPLFGNISPDIEPRFIINFIFRALKRKQNINKKNLFTKKYLSLFFKKKLFIKTSEIKNNKEWQKIHNNKIVIFFRNPEINGFDFNHSHNDYFHFVIFYKNKQLFVDTGRKNYFHTSEIYKLSKFHNTFLINGSNFLDNFTNFKSFKNIFFSTTFKYNFKRSKTSYEMVGSSKNFSFKRNFEIFDNVVLIKNNLKVNQKKKITFRFHISNEVKVIKKINKLKIFLKKKLILAKVNSKNKINLIYSSSNKKSNFQKYGDTVGNQIIDVDTEDSKNSKVNLEILFR